MGARGGADDDFVDVDVGGLVDGVGDAARDGFGFEGDGAEVFDHGTGAGIGDGVGEFGFDDAGGDDGHADVFVFESETFRDGAHGKLGAAVNGAGGPDLEPADGGDVDDVSGFAALHVGEHSGDAVEDTADVDVDHLVPFVDLKFVQGGEGHDAGVVDEDVDAAEFFEGEVGEGLGVFEVGDVQRAVFDEAAGGANFFGELFESVGATRSEKNLMALGGEMAGGGFADAAGGTGDKDDFGGVHRSWFLVLGFNVCGCWRANWTLLMTMTVFRMGGVLQCLELLKFCLNLLNGSILDQKLSFCLLDCGAG